MLLVGLNEEHVGIFNGGIDGGGVGGCGLVLAMILMFQPASVRMALTMFVTRLIGGIVFDGNGCLPDFATSIANELVDFTLEEEFSVIDDG